MGGKNNPQQYTECLKGNPFMELHPSSRACGFKKTRTAASRKATASRRAKDARRIRNFRVTNVLRFRRADTSISFPALLCSGHFVVSANFTVPVARRGFFHPHPMLPPSELAHVYKGLKRLNCRKLTEYYASPSWKRVKRGRRKHDMAVGPIVCAGCNRDERDNEHPGQKHHLHHMTYRNLGRETEYDLCWLCPECHEEFHMLVAELIEGATSKTEGDLFGTLLQLMCRNVPALPTLSDSRAVTSADLPF